MSYSVMECFCIINTFYNRFKFKPYNYYHTTIIVDCSIDILYMTHIEEVIFLFLFYCYSFNFTKDTVTFVCNWPY